jgi:HlyD family secretion protein
MDTSINDKPSRTAGDRSDTTEVAVGQHNGAHDLSDLQAQDDGYVASDYGSEGQRARSRWRWPLLAAGAIVLAIAVLWAALSLNSPAGVLTATVQRGNIISTVQTTGKLAAGQSVDVAFKSGGQVQRVLVKQGDSVEIGQVMAELDTTDLQRQLTQAELQLNISNLHLDQAKQGAPPQDLTVAEANLTAARSQLNQVKAGAGPQDKAAAQAFLAQAQAKLDSIKSGPSTQDLASAQAALDEAKANRDLVAAQGSNATEQARILLDQATAANPNLLDPTGTIEQARLNYDTAQKSEAAHNAIANGEVTQAQAALDKLKAGASPDDIRQAEETVAQAQANVDKLNSGPTADQVTEAQARVDAAQAALDKLKASPTEMDLSLLEQQVKVSQLSVDGAKEALNNAQLIAPIGGTVLALNLDRGQLVGGMQPVATVADTGRLQVTVDVDELDVGRVAAGQAVTVTLDSYPGVNMPGEMDVIAPGATQKQGSTVYEAKVSFTPATGVIPREGMAANVDITAQRKDNVLLLPNRAFETVGNRQYVTLQENGSTRTVEVETGLTNNTVTEVLSGLSEGQVVVLK